MPCNCLKTILFVDHWKRFSGAACGEMPYKFVVTVIICNTLMLHFVNTIFVISSLNWNFDGDVFYNNYCPKTEHELN